MNPVPAGAVRCAAVFDLDGTITRRGTWTPFVLHVACARRLGAARVAAALAPLVACAAGRIDRVRMKAHMLAAVLGDAGRAEIEAHAQAFVERCLQRGLRAGARAAIDRHRASGDYLVLATASLDLYAGHFAQALGFDAVIATRARWQGERLAGVLAPNCRGAAKLEAVERRLPGLRRRFRVIAYSDHPSDLPLLCWAHQGVAVNPSPRMRLHAWRLGLAVANWDRAAPCDGERKYETEGTDT